MGRNKEIATADCQPAPCLYHYSHCRAATIIKPVHAAMFVQISPQRAASLHPVCTIIATAGCAGCQPAPCLYNYVASAAAYKITASAGCQPATFCHCSHSPIPVCTNLATARCQPARCLHHSSPYTLPARTPASLFAPLSISHCGLPLLPLRAASVSYH